MTKSIGSKIEMNGENYVDHEVRLRILEHLSAQINNKMNVGLILIIGSLIIPIFLKWLGWV